MLAETPIVFALVGVAAYTVLAGADFGAGVWTLVPGGGRASRAATQDHARHAMGPVWEANHVWLIFVLVVCWTAYPVAFASIASTLVVPLFLAAVGIILRGTAYALRGTLDAQPGRRAIDDVFALSSVLTPFALGAVAGAIASDRVPVGNAAGDLVTSWLNPTSILVGTLAVAVSAYLAAVYLSADARRMGEPDLEHDFRVRALASGVVTGALAVAGLFVLRADARPLWDGLTGGLGLLMVAVSAVAGLATFFLVGRDRFEASRASAALAVAALVAGWAVAQRPRLLTGLTVEQAAAGRSTLIAIVVSVAVGAVLLVPSLLLLFRLFLRGRLDFGGERGAPAEPVAPVAITARGSGPPAMVALGLLVAGVVLTVVVGSGWALAVGVLCLCGTAVMGALLAVSGEEDDDRAPGGSEPLSR
ncbi:cytochrome d ubiquinol oxidase subunit II [Thermomonospora umbrina]|uniref:Cytochrome bd-I ubiquinol oxidase subunit 2 apoprotein n=1 Tax=Thermomonospora umbrina TaxID=111806 RepID=A0A3D9T022_9ACTN|nr:cytochrome d ubiquinol oxidase subunit II [Thermomonospora umbrina]REF00151.1 cytochrome bd-I ubiquinol oxidase subunit 2 apoprotein [Thermomonospora umbrina]